MIQIITKEITELRYSHAIDKNEILEYHEVYVDEIIMYRAETLKISNTYFDTDHKVNDRLFVGKVSAIHDNSIIIEMIGSVIYETIWKGCISTSWT